MAIHQRLRAAAGRAVRWHVHSQETARRNAMTASTILVQRRREIDEVEQFLDLHRRRYDARLGRATTHRSA